jgi:hypothetical protein
MNTLCLQHESDKHSLILACETVMSIHVCIQVWQQKYYDKIEVASHHACLNK